MNSGVGLSCELQEVAHMMKTVVLCLLNKLRWNWNETINILTTPIVSATNQD